MSKNSGIGFRKGAVRTQSAPPDNPDSPINKALAAAKAFADNARMVRGYDERLLAALDDALADADEVLAKE